VRVIRREDGELALDRSGPGRGAWLCLGSLACLERAARRRGLDRAFAGPVEADQVRRLRAQLVELWGAPQPMCEDGGLG
jgi:predicted RNA-binding protein YlxR (DUF448 family)